VLSDWLDSNWLRVLAYVVAAGIAFLAGQRELTARVRRPELWPTFWFLTGATLCVMALGRLGNVAEFVSDFGRRQARAEGWYEDRRFLQALAVGAVGFVWFSVVTVAIWRVPERRRRYLPMFVAVFSLLVFAAVRLVSLHHVDTILYRRPVVGVKIAALVELAGVVAGIAAAAWATRSADQVGRAREPRPVA